MRDTRNAYMVPMMFVQIFLAPSKPKVGFSAFSLFKLLCFYSSFVKIFVFFQYIFFHRIALCSRYHRYIIKKSIDSFLTSTNCAVYAPQHTLLLLFFRRLPFPSFASRSVHLTLSFMSFRLFLSILRINHCSPCY